MKSIMRRMQWLCCLLLPLIITSCGHQEVNNSPPSTGESIYGIFERKAGKFAGEKFDREEVRQYLKGLKPGPESDELWEEVLSLVGGEYRPLAEKYEAFDASVQIADPGIGPLPKTKGTGANLNVEVILDMSGSMDEKLNGKPKIDLAKQALFRFLDTLPEYTQVAVRVYGHTIKGEKEETKEVSCKKTEVISPFSPFNKKNVEQALSTVEPGGWTPIAYSLQAAKEDFSDYPKTENLNVIYLISDGLETCGGDPILAVKSLRNSHVTPIVNIIGFDVDNQGQRQLKKIADAGGGAFASVTNQEALAKQFEEELAKLERAWSKWINEAYSQREKIHEKKAAELSGIATEFTEEMETERWQIRTVIMMMQEEFELSKTETDRLNAYADERWNVLKLYNNEKWQDLLAELNMNGDAVSGIVSEKKFDAEDQIETHKDKAKD